MRSRLRLARPPQTWRRYRERIYLESQIIWHRRLCWPYYLRQNIGHINEVPVFPVGRHNPLFSYEPIILRFIYTFSLYDHNSLILDKICLFLCHRGYSIQCTGSSVSIFYRFGPRLGSPKTAVSVRKIYMSFDGDQVKFTVRPFCYKWLVKSVQVG